MFYNQKDFTDAAKRQNDIDPDAAPNQMWMLAFQFLEKEGQVAKELLLDPALKDFIPRDERKAIKKGELYADMSIIKDLKKLLAEANTRAEMQEAWLKQKATYPDSLLALAAELNATREPNPKINPKSISGDMFSGADMPRLDQDAFNKLRYEKDRKVLEANPNYIALSKKVEAIRYNLKWEKERKDYFKQMGLVHEALHEWEAEETKEKTALFQQKIIDLALFAAETEDKLQTLFVTGADAPRNQKLLGQGLSALTAASALAVSQPSDLSVSAAAPVSIEASANYSELQTPKAEACSTESPLLFDGKQFNFFLTDPQLCGYLMEIVPKVGETVEIGPLMTLRANRDGTFHFRLEAEKTRGECLQNAPVAIKREFIRESGVDACKETVVKTNTITARNFRAMIESVIANAGKDGKARLFEYYLAKWFLESRHGNAMSAYESSAEGFGQFMPPTWVDEVLHEGDFAGYGKIRRDLLGVNARMGINETQAMDGRNVRKISRFAQVREWHRKYNAEPEHGTILGGRFNVKNILRLKAGIESGRIPHPDGPGHTEITPAMAYSCQLLGFHGCRAVFIGIRNNPNQKIGNIVKGQTYKRNKGVLQAPIYSYDEEGDRIINRNGKPKIRTVVQYSAREFLDQLKLFGNDNTPIEGLDDYHLIGSESLAQNQNNAHLQLLRIRETRGVSFIKNKDNDVALEEEGMPAFLRRVHKNTKAVPNTELAAAEPAFIPTF